MLFEEFNREGDRVMYTTNPKCIPTKSEFLNRQKDGQTFKLDGKVVKTYDKLQENGYGV